MPHELTLMSNQWDLGIVTHGMTVGQPQPPAGSTMRHRELVSHPCHRPRVAWVSLGDVPEEPPSARGVDSAADRTGSDSASEWLAR